MCIVPDGEFYAPFDILAVKNLDKERMSAVHPAFRKSLPFVYNDPNRGTNLHYPLNEVVESPDGPGIHCWELNRYRDDSAKRALHAKPENRLTIYVIIPCGARVYWQWDANSCDMILAASEVIPVS